MRRSWSIRTLLYVLVLACILPPAVITVCIIAIDYQKERDQLIQNTIATTRSTIENVDQLFLGVEASLAALGTSPSIWDADLSKFYEQAQILQTDQIGRSIVLADTKGKQIINSSIPYGQPITATANAVQTELLRTTHAPVVSDLFRGGLDDRLIVSVAVPILRNGAHQYNLFSHILPSAFANVFADQGLDQQWIAAIIDRAGTFVARSKDSDRFIGSTVSRELLNALLVRSEGWFMGKTLEGIPVLATYSQSQITGWTAAIAIPTAVLTQELRNRLITLTLAVALTLMIGLTAAWLIGRRITNASKGLIAPALALGTGSRVSVPDFGLKEANAVGQALELASNKLATAQFNATHDSLTGLPNRFLFYEIAARQIKLAQRNDSVLSLLFIDLDGFKQINDQHGHAAGDHLLCTAAERLRSSLRSSDTASRLGGDEFAAALPDTSPEAAALVAKKVIDTLSKPYSFDGKRLQVSASIGVGFTNDRNTTIENLVRAADEAMYVAKNNGKAQVHISAG